MARDVVVIPHTHWDREWYEPFETFRMKLVDLVDDLLPMLESDPGFTHFMLDGQMAVVDDYLAVRPEAEARLRHLAGSGRLGVGPWYILMDEFMVSGETIVRDMQLGLDTAARFGGAMQVGYLPDMFGHVAQMPQILGQFGFEHAVVWRGVPAAIDKSAFWWEAPDGSRVRAEYLIEGYGNGADLPEHADELVQMVERFEDRNYEALVGPILWMNGTDHRTPKPRLPRLIADANATTSDHDLRIGTLADFLAAAPTDGLPTWSGELRSGARANLLMGVGSNRVDVHRACAAAERTIEKLAEPLCALFMAADAWPGSLLDRAWLELIRNSAHDSSCACSIDEVCDAVLVRYAQAERIGEGLAERAVDALAQTLQDRGPVLVNPTARARSGVVELTLADTDVRPGTQVLSMSDGLASSDELTRSSCETMAGMAMDFLEGLHDVEVGVDDTGVLEVKLHVDESLPRTSGAGPARAAVSALAAEDPDGPARMTLSFAPSQTLLTWVDEVPGFGWARWQPAEPTVPPVEVTGPDEAPTLSNGIVTVTIDPHDGTFSLGSVDGTVRVTGLGRLVDDGDAGDTYNYSPPASDSVVDTPDRVVVSVVERGPLRARVRVVRSYRWPESVFFGERAGEVTVDVTTTIELSAGSRGASVTVELDNRCRDHRLRAWFPLPTEAEGSRAECAFGVVARGLDAEGGPTETGLATFPSRRFVCAGGLTVVHDGLLEYELVDRSGEHADGPARALALTLLRATGLLSNGPMTLRPMPAGPIIPVDGAQVQGHHTARFAVMLGDDTDAAYAAADEMWTPLVTTTAAGGGSAPDRGTALRLDGAEVSAVLRDQGGLVVRVFNPSDESRTVRLEGRSGWLIDLAGRAIERFEGSFALGPWRIATARLDP